MKPWRDPARKPRCTDKVLRGILALDLPGSSDVRAGTALREDFPCLTDQDIDDANAALQWAREMIEYRARTKGSR